MKYLFVCNTYYQLIVTIQLKYTLLKNTEITLVMSDHSVNSYEYYKNLKELKFFDDLIFVHTKRYDSPKNIFLKIFSNLSVLFGYAPELSKFKNRNFDEIVFYNTDKFNVTLFSYLANFNPNIRSSRMEESVLSYIANDLKEHSNYNYRQSIKTRVFKITNYYRKMLQRRCFNDRISSLYCFYPSLYKGNLKTIKIPYLNTDDSKFVNLLKRIFDIKDDLLSFKERFIYFSSIGDFEGGVCVGEFELAKKIENIVGKNNLLVKSHPRDYRHVYEKNNFNVCRYSSVPWEVLMCCFDFSKHVFLANLSSSVLSLNMCIKNGPRTIFLFNFCKNRDNFMLRDSERALKSLLDILHKDNSFSRFMVPINWKELKKMLSSDACKE